MLSPGLTYIIATLPRFVSPAIIVYLLHILLRDFAGIQIPSFLVTIVCVASVPAWVSLLIILKDISDRRRAAALGAVIPPTVPSKYPAGFETLSRLNENARTGYFGSALDLDAERLGNTFLVRILYDNRIITSEPQYIKIILASDFNGYEKGPVFRSQVASVLGSGVFNSDGDMWKFHRSMTRPFFSKDRIGHFDIFDRHADDAISQMKARLRTGEALDFQDLVSRFTLDSATEFLFGTDVRSLSAGLPHAKNVSVPTPAQAAQTHPADTFVHAFLEAQIVINQRLRIGSAWPLWELFGDKSAKYMKVINAFIDPILTEGVRKKRESGEGLRNIGEEKEIPEGATLLDHLVNFTEDTTVLKDEILNIMIAGRDTTASTLTFLFYFLAMHPDILKRLREEIFTKIGPTRRPTYDDFRDMKFLRAVINETLRLFPPVPFNIRDAVKDTTWPAPTPGEKPWFIPAGTKVAYSDFRMHRRVDLWGPDALNFDPDRFLDDRVHKYLTPNPFIFLPFNAGPRICLGQQFAYNEISFMVVRLLQNFQSVALAPDAQPEQPPAAWAFGHGRQPIERVWPKFHITVYAKDGLWVRFEETTHT